MKNKTATILLAITLCISQLGIAQNSEVDSLLILLKTAKEDTNKANILYQLGERVDSDIDILTYANQLLALSEKLKFKKGMAYALNNIGYVNEYQGKINNALDYYLQSLKIFEEIGEQDGIAQTSINLGNIYKSQGDTKKAMESFLRSLELYRQLNNKQYISIALNNAGTTAADMRKYNEALDYFLEVLKIQEVLGDKNVMSYAMMNIGGIYINLNKHDNALEYLSRSLKLSKEVKNPRGTALCHTFLATVYLKKKEYKSAELSSLKALHLADSVNYSEAARRASATLSEVYASQNRFKEAYETHLLFKKLADSLLSDKTQKSTMQKQMQYEFEKKEIASLAEQEKKDLTVREEAQKQNIILWAVIVGLILVLVFSGFILNRWNVTRKQKKIIEQQKVSVEVKNKNIIDSINYAQRIQSAILPTREFLKQLLVDYFIFFNPKDIVSGDFYWAEKKNDKIFFATVDCTGHGVPGAFMSMIGNSILNEIVNKRGVEEADEILNLLREGVIHALKQSDDAKEQRDGMEIGLLIFDKSNATISFSGAYNSLYHFHNNAMKIYEGDKQTIGFENGIQTPFTKLIIPAHKGDMIYLFSDGFVDQRGGPHKKKFYRKPFQQMLMFVQNLPTREQEDVVSKTFNEWKGGLEQIDDVLVVGIRV